MGITQIAFTQMGIYMVKKDNKIWAVVTLAPNAYLSS